MKPVWGLILVRNPVVLRLTLATVALITLFVRHGAARNRALIR